MTEAKAVKSPGVAAPFARFTPSEALRNKSTRDARRILIRQQNALSKSLK